MDTLPDDVLLAIFDSYLNEYPNEYLEKKREEAWRSLVNVCRRWRSVVLESPGHLDLQLVCTGRTPTRDKLDVWPALPLIIKVEEYEPIRSVDNIIAMLERSDRVCRIDLEGVSSSNLEMILAAMQQPFPELTFLRLCQYNGTVPVVPDPFLGGFAPRLEVLALDRIRFPGLPKILLSATHLRFLRLHIPQSGYISPDAMVTILSTLTGLKTLALLFQSPRSCPNRATRHPPPSIRYVLPFLSSFMFKGVTEYLEDFVALIDTPQLNETRIKFFNDVEFDTPQFMQFISRSPMLRPLENVHIIFWDEAAYIHLSRASGHMGLNVEILCSGSDWQISSLEQVCTSCLPPLSMSEDLYIYRRPGWHWQLEWKYKIENGLWVELLHPFAAVKNLYLCWEFAPRIAPVLQELVGDRITEVLPTLENIFLEGLESSGFVEEGISQFVAAREVAGHPITISHWDGSKKIFEYYLVR